MEMHVSHHSKSKIVKMSSKLHHVTKWRVETYLSTYNTYGTLESNKVSNFILTFLQNPQNVQNYPKIQALKSIDQKSWALRTYKSPEDAQKTSVWLIVASLPH